MKDIKLGFIGLGARGITLLNDIILPMGERVSAVCDVYADRVEDAAKAVEKSQGIAPKIYTDYKELLNDGEVNAVVVSTSWAYHTAIASAALRAGKATALEVGGAYSEKQCWDLVNAYEETKTPFMFLENCCFGRREMMALNMVKKGLLGEVVHLDGGYMHDLRSEIAFGRENRHYRIDEYLKRNCENYPTHELGPIAKILDINRGNRFLTLTSVSSKARGMKEYIKNKKPDDAELNASEFAQGDIVTTIITCANGETVRITLDTTLPRFYSRGFTVHGTKGLYDEATDSVYIDTSENEKLHFKWLKEKAGNAADFEEEFDHPVWKEYIKEGVKGTHDGMDYLEFKSFFNSLRNGEPMEIDVYDAVSLMIVSSLSEASITLGGAPVSFPDFTGGKWIKKKEY